MFFEAAVGDRFETLYVLALTTGLRRGELLGLKWPDLDLERGTLGVNRSMDTLYGPPEEKAPKRQSSRRMITLVPEAVVALRVHKNVRLKRNSLPVPPGRSVSSSSLAG